MTTSLAGVIFSQVRCRRCNARLFDARPTWRHCEASVADILILCWRCNLLVGVKIEAGP